MSGKEKQSLSRAEVIRKSKDFRLVLRRGTRIRTRYFKICRAENKSKARIGITVSKKIGNAVVRNSVKRKIREFFRTNKMLFESLDTVIIAQKGSGQIDSKSVQSELKKALRKK